MRDSDHERPHDPPVRARPSYHGGSGARSAMTSTTRRRPCTVADRGRRRERRDLPPVDVRRRLRQGPRRRPGRQGPAAGERRRAAAVGADDEGPLPARRRSGHGAPSPRSACRRRRPGGPSSAWSSCWRTWSLRATTCAPWRSASAVAGRVLDDCMVELTEVSAEGRTTRTVAVESPDPDLVSPDGRPAGAGRSAQRLRRPGAQVAARLGTEAGSPSSTSAPTR